MPREPHPLDAVIWRALTSVHESLAEGDERARRYPAAIAPFAATFDMEPASFRSLLALVGGDDQIALFTTEEVQPPSALTASPRRPDGLEGCRCLFGTAWASDRGPWGRRCSRDAGARERDPTWAFRSADH